MTTQIDMFIGAAPSASEPPKERTWWDVASDMACRALGLDPLLWSMFRVRDIEGADKRVTHYICGVIGLHSIRKSGPRKGQRKWDRKSEREFVISRADLHAQCDKEGVKR